MRLDSLLVQTAPPPAEPDPPPRRRFLRLMGRLLGGAGLAGLLGGLPSTGGCAPQDGDAGGDEPVSPQTRIPLESLPPGERIRVLHAGRAVEVRRVAEEVVARSLVCTHFGCEVVWKAEEEVYACPCHEGRFAPDGRVLGGAPSRPLPEVPTRIDGAHAVLGG